MQFTPVFPSQDPPKSEELARVEPVPSIVNYLRACWDAAVIAKQPIKDRMVKSLRQRRGVYDPDKYAAIKATGMSEMFSKITQVKCRAFESWLRDILMSDGTPPWELKASPVPDLPPDVAEAALESARAAVVKAVAVQGQQPTPEQVEATKKLMVHHAKIEMDKAAEWRVRAMEREIKDQLAEGNWAKAFDDFITDLATYPCAFIKGPVVRRRKALQWEQTPEGWRAVPTDVLRPEYERVDPFAIYPEPNISELDDGYVFEVHTMSRSDIAALIGAPGFEEEEVRRVLREKPKTWISEAQDSEIMALTDKKSLPQNPADVYYVLEFWGSVSARMLIEWGADPDRFEDEDSEIQVNVWLVGDIPIKVMLNSDPLGQKPYTKSTFIKQPGSFWGESLPETIADIQGMCNAVVRALSNNMALASGPITEVNIDRLASRENVETVTPLGFYQTVTDPMAAQAPAFRFHQPSDNSASLLRVYEYFSNLADNHSGIPAYIYGDTNVRGAGRTASGLSMLMGAAGKGIRQVVSYIDNEIIGPNIHRLYVFNMRYNENEDIKGDAVVIPRGAAIMSLKDTITARQLEALNYTNNPVDLQIMGLRGRAELLREAFRNLGLNADGIIPTDEILAQQEQNMQGQAAQGGMPAPENVAPGGAKAGGLNMVSGAQSGQAV